MAVLKHLAIDPNEYDGAGVLLREKSAGVVQLTLCGSGFDATRTIYPADLRRIRDWCNAALAEMKGSG